MEKKALSKYLPIACGVLLLVVGILLCFRTQLGENAISIIMGAGSIAFGATFPGTETNIHNADESYPVAHLELLEKIYRTAAKALAEKLKKGEL